MLDKPAMSTCPCCHQTLLVLGTVLTVNLDYNSASRNGLLVCLEPQSVVLLDALNKRHPATVSYEALIRAMYGWTEPSSDNPNSVMKVRISRMRRALKPLGVSIKNVYGKGYRLELL